MTKPGSIKFRAFVVCRAWWIANVDANSGGPNYSEQSFAFQDYQFSPISAENIGINGGYEYSLHGNVAKNKKGNWYVYASASAWAPAAERQSDWIMYLGLITVFEGDNMLYSGNLRTWNNSTDYLVSRNHTYIGNGYMPLPATGNNISVEIKINYNMNQGINTYAYPMTPYIYRINF